VAATLSPLRLAIGVINHRRRTIVTVTRQSIRHHNCCHRQLEGRQLELADAWRNKWHRTMRRTVAESTMAAAICDGDVTRAPHFSAAWLRGYIVEVTASMLAKDRWWVLRAKYAGVAERPRFAVRPGRRTAQPCRSDRARCRGVSGITLIGRTQATDVFAVTRP
jgi:hypothetical protein